MSENNSGAHTSGAIVVVVAAVNAGTVNFLKVRRLCHRGPTSRAESRQALGGKVNNLVLL